MHRSRELASYTERAGGTLVAAHPYRRQMPWFSRNDEVTIVSTPDDRKATTLWERTGGIAGLIQSSLPPTVLVSCANAVLWIREKSAARSAALISRGRR